MDSLSQHILKYEPGSLHYYSNDYDFDKAVQEVFQYQIQENPVYKEFVRNTGRTRIASLSDIPFLPVEVFKRRQIQSGNWDAERFFLSSGTTDMTRARHVVYDEYKYHRHTINIFERSFGPLKDMQIFGLLPNYLEAGDSSLVSMVCAFMNYADQKPEQGFYLHDLDKLARALDVAAQSDRPILLFGVTFALIDFVKRFPMALPDQTIVIETGGMKGRGMMLDRQKLHDRIAAAFSLPNIYSEYGMTELMSQAYTNKHQQFVCPPSMYIMVKELNDPFKEAKTGKVGLLHIIDLANVHTASFLATGDLGIKHDNGTFAVLGRLDTRDLRGCHMLYPG